MTNENLPDTTEISAYSSEKILDTYSVNPEQGLTPSEVDRRRQKYGENRLQETKGRSLKQIFIEQFKSPIIGLLALAAVLSFAFQEWVEAIAIIIAIILNAAIGFFTEVKATRAMEALQQLSRTKTTVRRDAKPQEISAEELVPGDIVLLNGGDLIPADLRVIEASKLQVDESPLTGESVPVTKTTEPIEGDLPLAERKNMVFKGTAITSGTGEGVVAAIGMNTELGHISQLTASAEEEVTPLEKRLDRLGQNLIWITLVIATLIVVGGLLAGKDLYLMVETAIALSVAAVPEGLPIVATVALARGMWRMAKRNAIINRLSAVETLGATSIICTDKTGTLTENRMTVSEILVDTGKVEVSGQGLSLSGEFSREDHSIDVSEDKVLRSILEAGILCNNAHLPDEETDSSIGDPMEVALLVAGAKAGLKREELLNKQPEAKEVAFDSETNMMATYHNIESGYRVAVKGAPESVLPICTQKLTPQGVEKISDRDRKRWEQEYTQMAEQGLRLLALAQKTVNQEEAEPYEDLTFLGVVGLLDPPREDVKEAIKACHQAGIRVIMLTGDLPITARRIGVAVGLVQENEVEPQLGKVLKPLEDLSEQEQLNLQQVSIFARVSPEQKLNLIALHQSHNAIVAMTGDGVNDAPALKKADIGVAMGQRGTEVAKEAADMVLQDDAFASIIAAIEQGRAIFENIRKFTFYLLSGNTGEIIAVAVASALNAPLPLLPLQILFLNAVNDVFPALALGVGEGSPKRMEHPPRDSKEEILTRRHWWAIVIYGVIIGATILGIFALCLQVFKMEVEKAVTISFLTLAFGRLWHVFNMRNNDSPLFRNEVTQNPYIWGALVLCSILLLIGVYVPPIAQVLVLVHPGLEGWGLILGASLIPLIIGQIWKTFLGKRKRQFI
ncbi:ATPase, P-type (transporting), HAD superfamily, subfamily IC [Gloeothece citriformis PCC 7424]|uniref:ATPase, P-type (Transporting), HAD superfamily, subfamily IC n=1 Tax=Gloeothece citriformis (strain PCC 7424) TaxID=65393 RepID=B7KDR2_GLOC7|nr:HAD-IC family P-type ATPase [Gloeothece citriformis]ACK70364.1 ATPase, P-type (transporting), HAD superfamily, subfamily IC [Gloeothece citriformis PCC 7424]